MKALSIVAIVTVILSLAIIVAFKIVLDVPSLAPSMVSVVVLVSLALVLLAWGLLSLIRGK